MPTRLPPVPEAPIHDRRVVEFRPAALSMAMHGFGRARFGAPTADVHSATPIPDCNAVRFLFGAGGAGGEMLIDGDRLAALIIGYCGGARIPLPRHAAKHMVVTDQGVRFDFAVSYGHAPEFRSRSVPPGAAK